jgi:AcrR family transcriptional regulator
MMIANNRINTERLVSIYQHQMDAVASKIQGLDRIVPKKMNGASAERILGGRPRDPKIDQAVLQAAAKLVLSHGLRSVSIDAIAAEANVGRTAIYRRWPNKAAIVMDAFAARVDPSTLFVRSSDYLDSIRLQMRTMARAFRGKDGALLRILLAEAQQCPDVAEALKRQWTMPRRKMAVDYFEEGIRKGLLRGDVNPDIMIDVLYAPLYYRLQMGIGALTDHYVDEVFEHAMRGLRQK